MYRNRSGYLGETVIWLSVLLGTHSALASGQVQAQPSAPSAPVASSFAGPLWQVVSPVGGTASVSNEHLFLNVPGGSSHDAFKPSNQALRVVQPIGNQNFDVSIKIDSPIVATDANTSRGLMLLADDKNFVTLALETDGTNLGLRVHSVTNGVASTIFEKPSFNEYQNPMYLRFHRTGTAYIAYYSIDGVVWSQAAAFTENRIPTQIGPFAGNYNSNPAHAVAVVMAINWFNIL